MKCKYCLTETSVFRQNESLSMKKGPLVYKDGSELKKNMDYVTDIICNNLGASILKISGGEILLIKGIIDYIKKHAPNYKKVQILTNGVLLTPSLIEQLKEMENVCIQISIDHHTVAGNMYRTPDTNRLQTILDNLDLVVRAGIKVEINCVLHDKNTHLLCSFCDYLMKYKKYVTLFPFPIRGKNKSNFYPRNSQLSEIKTLIDRYTEFQEILPPKIYLEYLLHFLQSGKREIPCVLPKIAIGSFDNGDITPCANYWFTSLGNLLNENPQKVLGKIKSDRIYDVLTHDRIHPIECVQCFTPWEILNLYAQGELSIDDLRSLPLYDFDELEEALGEIQKKENI